MKKRLLILCSVMVLIVAMAVPAFAAEATESTEDPLQGTWIFHDKITLDDGEFLIEFSSNNKNYDRVYMHRGVFYRNPVTVQDTRVYDELGWKDTNYKTITIKSKLTEVNNGNDLLTYLQNNAEKAPPPPPPPPPVYNAVPDSVSGGLPGILGIIGSILTALFTPSGDLFQLGMVIAVCFVVALIYGGFRLFKRVTPGV